MFDPSLLHETAENARHLSVASRIDAARPSTVTAATSTGPLPKSAPSATASWTVRTGTDAARTAQEAAAPADMSPAISTSLARPSASAARAPVGPMLTPRILRAIVSRLASRRPKASASSRRRSAGAGNLTGARKTWLSAPGARASRHAGDGQIQAPRPGRRPSRSKHPAPSGLRTTRISSARGRWRRQPRQVRPGSRSRWLRRNGPLRRIWCGTPSVGRFRRRAVDLRPTLDVDLPADQF